MDDLIEQKAQLRTQALSARKLAHEAGAAEGASAGAHARLLAALEGAQIVAGYMPIRTEIDPLPAMARLVARGAQVCVPVIEGAGLPLRFRAWTPETVMVPGAFGAAVPEAGAWLRPDALIVPLVAFDARLGRLGYGGGFYDRTLEGLRAEGLGADGLGAGVPLRALGFAYDAQELPAVPQEPTDQPLDGIITPTRSLWAR